MKQLKLLPLIVAMTGAITAFSSYADMIDSTKNNVSNSFAIPYNNTTETAGFYLSGQLGAQFNNAQVGIKEVATKIVMFDKAITPRSIEHAINLLGGVALGYQANNNFRFELAYSGNLTDKPTNNHYIYDNIPIYAVSIYHIHQATQLDTSLQTMMANAYYTFDTHNKFSPFIMAGMGVAHVNGSLTKEGVGTDSRKTGNFSFISSSKLTGKKNPFAWNVGVGGSYHLTPNLSLDGMVSYVNAGSLHLSGTGENKYHNGSIEYFNSTADIRLDAMNVLLGIRYVF